MKKTTYQKRMKEHEDKFDLLWSKVVKDTNEFLETNPEVTGYHIEAYWSNSVSKFTDNLCLSGAWIVDSINGRSGVPSSSKYKGSLTKKIRKALGFNI